MSRGTWTSRSGCESLDAFHAEYSYVSVRLWTRLGCRNLRARGLLTLCIGCNLCRPSGMYVHVGFRQRVGEAQASPFAVTLRGQGRKVTRPYDALRTVCDAGATAPGGSG